jgi:phage gpG-like protein
MIGLRFQVFDGATPALEALLAKGADLSPLMDRWGAALASLVQQGFIAGHSPYGVQWASLKLRQGQPLRDKGSLMNSITWNPHSNSVDVGPGFGPSSKGAAVQQFGATIKPVHGAALRFKAGGRWYSLGKVTIPARPYLPNKKGGLPQEWQGTLLRETAAYLMGNS